MPDDTDDRLITKIDGVETDLNYDIAKFADAHLNTLIDLLDIPTGKGSRFIGTAVRNYLLTLHMHRPGMKPYRPSELDAMTLPQVIGEAWKVARKVRGDAPQPSTQKRLADVPWNILSAMRELGAVESDHRKSAGEIARAATGGPANSIKHIMVELKGRGLIESMGGRSGGHWLTSAGLEMVRTEAHRL